ncbi:hypothetical protein SUGI_1091240 [Cryptomeria japonica]|nr:hypothetical protein SUGI_1091240 [Cryptomeria japonica]
MDQCRRDTEKVARVSAFSKAAWRNEESSCRSKESYGAEQSTHTYQQGWKKPSEGGQKWCQLQQWVWNEKSVIEQCGFWGLPSFINHSCFPNAKRIVIGKAIFIIAVRGIAAEEQITVPYTRSLYPLVVRERDFTPLGFRCECKRCVLERSLDPSLQELSPTICNYLQCLTKPTNISFTKLEFMIGFALMLEEIDAKDEVKQLILASFHVSTNLFWLPLK